MSATVPIYFRPPAVDFWRFRLGQQLGHFPPRNQPRGGLHAEQKRADDEANTTNITSGQ
jgi:hypothetical protein